MDNMEDSRRQDEIRIWQAEVKRTVKNEKRKRWAIKGESKYSKKQRI